MSYLKKISLSLLSLLLVLSYLEGQSGKTTAIAKNGMVVTSHYLGSQAGSDILKKGGNAIDAAVATGFAMAVVHPSAGNIGGGGFLVYHGADGNTTSFNFREKAPLKATETMYLNQEGELIKGLNHFSPLAVGVPGTVAGLWQAHQKYGKLPWKDLLQPAIDLAEKGHPASWRDQAWLKRIQGRKEAIYDATKKAFLKNGNSLYEPGELFKQPDLAATLKRIQKEGKDGFYKGNTAKLIAKYMKKHDGLITKKDLAAYEAVEQDLIHGTYRGYDVYGMAPPSSGGVAIVEMLNILEGYNLKEIGHNSALYLHLLTESMRAAFADRAQHLGDPAFNPDMPLKELTSKAHADKIRPTINWYQATESDSSKFNQIRFEESEETTHYSIVDADGNAVSLTYTLEYSYGSSITVAGAGFLLNNEMGDFNPVPGVTNSRGMIGTKANLIAPEKRMLSSMSPTIVAKDGKPVIIIGSPGGRTIINTTLQVILNVIDHKMDIAQAIEAGRIHHQWLPDITTLEDYTISPDTERLYKMMGHTVRYRKTMGRAMGIFIDYEEGLLYGGADSRSFDGKAVGY